MRRAVAVTVVVTAGALLLGALAATAKGPPPGGGGGPSARVFELKGSVDGLYPGADLTLPVRVDNPQRFPIRLLDLAVTVADTGSGCPATAISIGDYPGGATVPARGEAVIDLPVTMLPDAPNACQGAQFALTYHATADRA